METQRRPADPEPPSIERQATRVRVIARPRRDRRDARGPAHAARSRMAIRAAARARRRSTSRSRCGPPGTRRELAVGLPARPRACSTTPGVIDGSRSPTRRRTAAPTTRSPSSSTHPFDASTVAERHFVATASCGICGKASLDEIEVRARADPARPGRRARDAAVPAGHAARGPGRVRGTPAACTRPACSTPDGSLARAARGRRPAQRARQARREPGCSPGDLPLNDRIVLVSGRASFELVQKAAVAGVPILAAVCAPSRPRGRGRGPPGRHARRASCAATGSTSTRTRSGSRSGRPASRRRARRPPPSRGSGRRAASSPRSIATGRSAAPVRTWSIRSSPTLSRSRRPAAT